MQMPLLSRVIFTLVSLTLVVGAHLADCSPSHIFNDLWPPHAKFHTGQTLSFSIYLAIFTVYFAFRKTRDKLYAVTVTAAFASAYWITQGCASFYPGTAFVDPNFASSPGAHLLGVPAQLVIGAVHLTLIAVACFIALKPGSKWTGE